jgi:hypothetical protein
LLRKVFRCVNFGIFRTPFFTENSAFLLARAMPLF